MVWSAVDSGLVLGGCSERCLLLKLSSCAPMWLSSSTSFIGILSPCKIVNSLRKGIVLNISLYLSPHLPGSVLSMCPQRAQRLVFLEAVRISQSQGKQGL